MSYTRRDYEDVAADLNSVLRHALPDTIKDRADTIWLAALAISRGFKGKNPHFDDRLFMRKVFKGFEQYQPGVS